MATPAEQCGICQGNFAQEETPTAKAASPFCACTYHTACLLSRAVHYGMHHYYQPCQCPSCGTTLYAPPTTYSPHSPPTPPPEVAQEIQDSPAFKRDLKALRAKVTATGKATAAYRKAANQAKKAWREATLDQIAALKASQKEAILNLKGTDAYKAWRSSGTSMKLAAGKFQKKYSITRYQLYHLAPGYRIRRSFAYRYSYFRWMFRIRV